MQDEKQNGLLIVNYHYIRDARQYRYPGIYPLERDAFVGQVRWLLSRFKPLSTEEIEAFVHGETALHEPGLCFTFDDGLGEHGWAAREVLEPLGVKAVFSVSSKPLIEEKGLMVHKIHWLRANTEPEKFRKEFMSLVPKEWLRRAEEENIANAAAQSYPYDSRGFASLKYMINFQLPNRIVDDIASEMLRARKVSESSFCRDYYLSKSEIAELCSKGHTIGNHGHSHTPFSRLSEGDLEREISDSLSFFSQLTGKEQTWVSYPHGRQWAIPADAEAFCRRFGFKIGLGLDGGWNKREGSPYLLNRINENDLKKLFI
jgi:peptidoglycan/xylan/chitin deacetylase (PgdA/CDA1 family)